MNYLGWILGIKGKYTLSYSPGLHFLWSAKENVTSAESW